jgi:hypothetical protein
MQVSGIIGRERQCSSGGHRRSPVSGAWIVFFALSFKRSGGWIDVSADGAGDVQPGTEFVVF